MVTLSPGLPGTENLMNSTLRPTDVQNLHPFLGSTRAGNRQSTVRPRNQQPAAEPPGRRFNRVAIGIWLGGLTLVVAGCILGASMPYRHPVGVTISILWWGIYLGCLGASIGAGIGGLVGLLWDRTPVSTPRASASGHPCHGQAATGTSTSADQFTRRILND